MRDFWHVDLGSIMAILTIGVPAWLGLYTMKVILRDYRPHKHVERHGHLRVEGISYPRMEDAK